LLYMAISRARDRLDISYVGSPSEFLSTLGPYLDIADVRPNLI
jgi:hypothetical protein